MSSPALSRRLRRFAPLLAAAPLCLAGAAAAWPGASREALANPRPALGSSGHVAATPAVPGGRLIHAPFLLTNTGEEPLTVHAVEPDCGCLTPLLNRALFDPKEPPTIGPGESLELIVRADTAREAEGPHEHTVTVVFERADGESLRQTVKMRYGVDPHEIRIEPPAMMVYQREGQSTTSVVTVTDRRIDPLRIVAVRSPTDRVHVETLDPVAREDGGWDFPFEVTVVGCRGGGNEVTVAVEVDDPAERYRYLKLPITVRSPDRLQEAAAERATTARGKASTGDSGAVSVSR